VRKMVKKRLFSGEVKKKGIVSRDDKFARGGARGGVVFLKLHNTVGGCKSREK